MTSLGMAWRGLACTGLAALFSGLSGQVHSLAGRDLGGALGLSGDEASWVTTAGTAAEGAAVLVAAPVFFAFGARRVVLAAALGGGLAGLLGWVDLPPEVALLARLLGGFAIGLPPVVMMVWVLRNFPPLQRALPLMLFALASSLPSALAASTAGLATLHFGGRAGFLVDLAWAGPIALLALWLLPKEEAKLGLLTALDWVGYFLLAGGTAMLVVVLSQGERRFWLATPFMLPLVASSIVFAALAVARLLAAPRPWLDLSLLRRPSFSVGLTEAVSLRFALMLGSFAVPQALLRLQGFRPEQAGEAVLWLAAGQALSFPLAWLWLRRSGADGRWPLALGLAASSGAALLGAMVDLHWGGPEFGRMLMVAGFGQGLFLTAVLRFATTEVPPPAGASAAGLFNLSRVLGQAGATAAVSAMLRLREAFHSARLVQEVTPASQAAAERLADLTTLYAGVTTDVGVAASAALAHLANETSNQAYILAFGDVFLGIAAVLAAAALLIPLLPRLGDRP
jgi:DHA2 family multidrug resistance protein